MSNILLSNLIKIRWIAIFGQLIAILFVYFILKINIFLIPCIFALITSVSVNFYSYFLQKKKNNISDKQAFFFLLYDTIQLSVLLYLTGGIINPFIILIIAPIIISATYLVAIWTILLSLLSITLIFTLNYFYIPLEWNEAIIIPRTYQIGLLLSLLIAIIFIAVYVYLFATSARKISDALSETKLQLSNQKKITEVGSLSAAAVHELSTPLNTIFLVLNDFLKDKKLIKNLDVLEDIELLKSEAERCKNILLKLSKNPQNLKDNFLKKVKISDIVKINFEKFNTNKILKINTNNRVEKEIIFKDEIMYAVGNLIQNAIIYSKKFVFVDIKINTNIYNIIISDDGPGFPKDIIEKLGQPYVSKNKKGLGLGIFISKNLIEGLNGEIFFKNSKNNKAVVEINLNINKL